MFRRPSALRLVRRSLAAAFLVALQATLPSAHSQPRRSVKPGAATDHNHLPPTKPPAPALRVTRTDLGSGVHMVRIKGGNVAVSIGEDGAFMVDDQFAPHHDRLTEELQALTSKPLKFLVNTHWHGDHTGGNAAFAGDGAVIVAHENVRQRMSTDQFNAFFNRSTPASPKPALPVVTFSDRVTFHFNGQTVRVRHVQHAHTDGDAIVQFLEANVIHAGDTFFHGLYPFIDGDSGGSLGGLIQAVDVILSLADDETKIIPGHGSLATKADLEIYQAMLRDMQIKFRAFHGRRLTVEQVLAAKPTAAYDEVWGKSFLPPEKWTRMLYRVSQPLGN